MRTALYYLGLGLILVLYHCQILWMGTKRGRPRGNHFPYILFQY